jgi:sarcosine oxidase
MASNWDVIVIGLGGVGSAAAYHAARSGHRVLGLEQFTPAHDRGSSHGQTRIIRQAYFEHPSYVPLLQRAYTLWHELETNTHQVLFHRTGLVEAGPADGVVIPGVLASARQHALPIDRLSHAEVSARWPGLSGNPDWTFVLEQNAGFLRVEACVEAHLSMAQQAGATLRFETPVLHWRANEASVEVTTQRGTEHAARLIIAGGAWSDQLLNGIGVPLQILRKHLYWFDADRSGYELSEGFPCFFHETPAGYFYGFPSIDGSGVKVARHSGGEPLQQPQHNDQQDDKDRQRCEAYLRQCLPSVSSRLRRHATCFYTNTPDEHFIIDQHPLHRPVTVVAGLSGHGFKFTSVLGELASQLATGTTQLDIDLFRIARLRNA